MSGIALSLARTQVEAAASALDQSRRMLEMLAQNPCLSPELRLELHEAAQHIYRDWCDDERAAHASGLICLVDEELKKLEHPTPNHEEATP